jgi:hypothetical protein
LVLNKSREMKKWYTTSAFFTPSQNKALNMDYVKKAKKGLGVATPLDDLAQGEEPNDQMTVLLQVQSCSDSDGDLEKEFIKHFITLPHLHFPWLTKFHRVDKLDEKPNNIIYKKGDTILRKET